MMTTIRNAMARSADRRAARRLYKATAHLDRRTLADIGVSRDEWLRLSYRTT